MRRPLAAAFLAAVLVTPVCAQQQEPFEPEGYRTDNYRAPVPATLARARVLTTEETETIWRAKSGASVEREPEKAGNSRIRALALDEAESLQ